MKTVLVTGKRGQLARALRALGPDFAARGYALHNVGRPEFDFNRPESIDTVFAAAAPAIVINAAGWTKVDLAEAEPEAAARANDSGPARLGELCAAADIPYIHLSTDYVFDGAKGAPYRETDRPHPIGRYGATKLAGERRILARGGRAVILRTSWLYAAEGENFVRAILTDAQRRSVLRVVADQRGSPTNAEDLAQAIFAIAMRIDESWQESDGGVFHITGGGHTTWHGFAVAICDAASRHGRPVPDIVPITTAEWPTVARRPADSRLDCARLESVFGIRLPDWRSSLERTVARICRPDSAQDSAIDPE
jgi:dTDP-4-dehydrorhamnose reductase